jgi:alkaline phosphatase D
MDQSTATPFHPRQFPFVEPEDVVEVLDAGKTYNGGRPPETIRFNGIEVSNPKRRANPQSMLGAQQKASFLEQLRQSRATWKLWGNSVGLLDWRIDFQNLPREIGVEWPTSGYALFSSDDWSGYRTERAEILDMVRREGIPGLASIAGDRHSFQAGVVAKSLPPRVFEPVAVEFVTGSVSAPGLFEAAEYNLPKDHPLWSVYLQRKSPATPIEAAINLSIMRGVKASLEMQRTGELNRALTQSNKEVSPHLSFMDAGGHGYSVVKADGNELEVEFVCIPRPLERSAGADGGPISYRVKHRVKRWANGKAPRLERTLAEGSIPWGS